METLVIPYTLGQDAKEPWQRPEGGDAGYDLFATEDITIAPLERKIVPTRLKVAIPPGYYGRVAPRSGLAVKNGIDVLAGVIDADYRGEIGVVLINLNFSARDLEFMISNSEQISSFIGSPNTFRVTKGDKIAQLIIEPCAKVKWEQVYQLPNTVRNEAGYGSSGI